MVSSIELIESKGGLTTHWVIFFTPVTWTGLSPSNLIVYSYNTSTNAWNNNGIVINSAVGDDNMELGSNEIAQIVTMLEHADGEDLQDILNQLGMDSQMLRQLIMTMPLETVIAWSKERFELEKSLSVRMAK